MGPLHVFCSSNFKTNQEDKDAGEDLGLQSLSGSLLDDV